MAGLDGEYWSIGDEPRSRKPIQSLAQDETFLCPQQPTPPRKKRAPLTEEQKYSINEKRKKTAHSKRLRKQHLQEIEVFEKQQRLDYLQEKDRVQREGIEILDGLFVGGRLSAMNYDLLKTRDVRGILNATTEVRLYFSDTQEFDYMRVAVNDAREERISDFFDDTYEFIERHLNQSRGVHVHCQMGQSRSCSIIVAFMMKSKGWSLRESMQHLNSKHACVGINEGFKKQLVEYETSLFGQSSMNFLGSRSASRRVSEPHPIVSTALQANKQEHKYNFPAAVLGTPNSLPLAMLQAPPQCQIPSSSSESVQESPESQVLEPPTNERQNAAPTHPSSSILNFFSPLKVVKSTAEQIVPPPDCMGENSSENERPNDNVAMAPPSSPKRLSRYDLDLDGSYWSTPTSKRRKTRL